MMERASDRIVAKSREQAIAVDILGRSMTIRQLGALDRLRLFKAIGPQLAENSPYLGMAMLAMSVTDIDGVPVPAPGTEAQLEALVDRLGDEGISAVAETLERLIAPSEDTANSGN